MTRVTMMATDQINRLVEIAKADRRLWENMKDREKNHLNPDGSMKMPSIAMLVEEFVRTQYGSNHNFDIGSLIIQFRYNVRLELGVSV